MLVRSGMLCMLCLSAADRGLWCCQRQQLVRGCIGGSLYIKGLDDIRGNCGPACLARWLAVWPSVCLSVCLSLFRTVHNFSPVSISTRYVVTHIMHDSISSYGLHQSQAELVVTLPDYHPYDLVWEILHWLPAGLGRCLTYTSTKQYSTSG